MVLKERTISLESLLKGLCVMSCKCYVATERLKKTQIAHVAGDLGKGSPRFSITSWDSYSCRLLVPRSCTLEKARKEWAGLHPNQRQLWSALVQHVKLKHRLLATQPLLISFLPSTTSLVQLEGEMSWLFTINGLFLGWISYAWVRRLHMDDPITELLCPMPANWSL